MRQKYMLNNFNNGVKGMLITKNTIKLNNLLVKILMKQIAFGIPLKTDGDSRFLKRNKLNYLKYVEFDFINFHIFLFSIIFFQIQMLSLSFIQEFMNL